jgi:RNase P/RNase MRP subunit p30
MKSLDLMLPRENEAELATAAKELGITPVFLYAFRDKKEILRKKDELKKTLKDIPEFYVGVYTIPRSAGDIKRLTKQFWLSADFLAVINPGELVRLAASNPRIDAVFRVPTIIGRDSTEYRKSNWNTILTNISVQNKVSYGIDFSYFLENSGYSLAKLLGREMQNVRLCRRKTKILIASLAQNAWQLRMPDNLSAFGRLLGLNAGQSRTAVSSSIRDILVSKEKRRSGKFVRPGVELVD